MNRIDHLLQVTLKVDKTIASTEQEVPQSEEEKEEYINICSV
jgi:hypothetical protein